MTEEVFLWVSLCVRGKNPDDFVFTWKNGRKIRDFRGLWKNVTTAAGVPGLHVHDLRRSAVRNMVRRGIPEVVAMKISGHLTRSVFDRYNIVSEVDISDAARRIEQGREKIVDTRRTGTKRGQPKWPDQQRRAKPGVAELADAADSKTKFPSLQTKDLQEKKGG